MLCPLEKRRADSFVDVDNFWLNLKARREQNTTAWNTLIHIKQALNSFVEISCLQLMPYREEGTSFGPCKDILRAVQPDDQGAGDQRGGERGCLPGARLHECSSAAS